MGLGLLVLVMFIVLTCLCSQAAIQLNRGDLSTVNNTMAMCGMSGESLDVWFQLFQQPDDFMRYMVNSTVNLQKTRNASIVEYKSWKDVEGVGKVNTLIWILPFQCADEQCRSFSPSVITEMDGTLYLVALGKGLVNGNYVSGSATAVDILKLQIYKERLDNNGVVFFQRNIFRSCEVYVDRRPAEVVREIMAGGIDGCYVKVGGTDKIVVLGHIYNGFFESSNPPLYYELDTALSNSTEWEVESLKKCFMDDKIPVIKRGESGRYKLSLRIGSHVIRVTLNESCRKSCLPRIIELCNTLQRQFTKVEEILGNFGDICSVPYSIEFYEYSILRNEMCGSDLQEVDPSVFHSVLSRVDAQYLEQHKLAFEVDNGQATNNLTVIITILASFVSVISATLPLTNLQLKILKMYSMLKTAIDRIAIILMLSNVVLSLLPYYPVLLLAMEEGKRQEEYKAWALVAQKLAFTEKVNITYGTPSGRFNTTEFHQSLPMQILLFIQTTSWYKSSMLPVAWILLGLSPPIVAAITYYRCKALAKLYKGNGEKQLQPAKLLFTKSAKF